MPKNTKNSNRNSINKQKTKNELRRAQKLGLKVSGKDTVFSKREVDAIFYEAMGVLGVSYLVKKLVYLYVRVFGDSSGYKK
jgi:hypothetical protein